MKTFSESFLEELFDCFPGLLWPDHCLPLRCFFAAIGDCEEEVELILALPDMSSLVTFWELVP